MSEIWAALPPRKSRRVDRRENKLPPNSPSEIPISPAQDTIESNVEKRANQHWAPQSLESKDGCSGEFYEYLDHTADVQLHAWGSSLEKAFENIVPCMFNYMTDLATVKIDPVKTIEFTVTGN
jgi:hypothetical protein